MYRIPSMSSKKLCKLLEKGGATFVRQKGDHAIYARVVKGKRFSAPVMSGKKTLDPNYCKRIFRQLKFTNNEIEEILR